MPLWQEKQLCTIVFFSGVNGSNEEMDSIFFSQDVLALFISASCYDS